MCEGSSRACCSNPGVDTIEGDVFKAFVMAGAISEDNSTSPQKVRPDPRVRVRELILFLLRLDLPAQLAPTQACTPPLT